MGFRIVADAVLLAGAAALALSWAGIAIAPAFAQSGSITTLPAEGAGSITTLPATGGTNPPPAATGSSGTVGASSAESSPTAGSSATPAASASPAVQTPAPAPVNAGHCAIWSTSAEDDSGTTHPTATACSSTADDSTAIGVQCPDGKAQIRYYPQESDLPKGIRGGSKLAMDFGVDTDHLSRLMQYDEANGVFTAALKKAEPLLTLLQSGGPLIVSSPELGSHTFRLVGSTAAMQQVFADCTNAPEAAAVPAPALPKPKPQPRVQVAPHYDDEDDDDGYYYYRPYNDEPYRPRRYQRYGPPRRRFFLPDLFGD